MASEKYGLPHEHASLLNLAIGNLKAHQDEDAAI
jgi:hypothetical protein